MPQKTTSYRPTPTSPITTAPTAEARVSAIEDLDDFMAEIDDLLETNALEIVRAYVQRSGE